jgi:hypothetical protein
MRLTMVGLARMWMQVALEMEQHVVLADDDPHRRTDAP